MEKHINPMQEYVASLTAKKFGKQADAIDLPEGMEQIHIFNEYEATADDTAKDLNLKQHIKKKGSQKKKGKKAKDFSKLPVTRIDYELSKDEQTCPICGEPLHDMKVAVTRTLTLIPARMEVEEHRRHLYTCRHCEQTQGEGDKLPFIKAAMPKRPIPGGIPSAELITAIINSKYVNAMPLARMERDFERYGMPISRQSMSNWVLYCAEHYFTPMYEQVTIALKAQDIIHGDETYLQVVDEPGRQAEQKSYLWTYCSGEHSDKPIVCYDYHPSRSQEAANAFLGDYHGFLTSDGYEVYHQLGDGITVTAYLAHIRRKFTDALRAIPKDKRAGTECYRGERYCHTLFQIDKKYNDLTPEERKVAREHHLKPEMDAFLAWLKTTKEKTIPKSMLDKAVTYALNQWPYFENILKDGRLELTNNRCERSIRPVTIGRKNWVTMQTPRGATASAITYSLVQSALVNDLKPYDYFVHLLKTLPDIDPTAPEALEPLMAWSRQLPENCYKPNEKEDEA